MDVFTRESPAIEVGQALKGPDVVEALNQLRIERSVPKVLFCDNGSEFTSQIMDPWAYQNGVKITFDSSVLRQRLLRHKIAELPELKRVLGTDTAVTVFRKLKQLGYLASYTHRGRFYTLPKIARSDDRGLWSHEAVWFSRYGTLLSTVEAFALGSSNGYYAHELADVLHAEVQEPLRHLVRQGRLRRTEIDGQFLYTAIDPSDRRNQILARRSAQAVPLAVHSVALQVSPDELKAAIVLFYGLLDEQQRRLFAGLESTRVGHGGDTLLGDFLGLDAHTVARGRQQLLDQDVVSAGTRPKGGGRQSTKKKRQA